MWPWALPLLSPSRLGRTRRADNASSRCRNVADGWDIALGLLNVAVLSAAVAIEVRIFRAQRPRIVLHLGATLGDGAPGGFVVKFIHRGGPDILWPRAIARVYGASTPHLLFEIEPDYSLPNSYESATRPWDAPFHAGEHREVFIESEDMALEVFGKHVFAASLTGSNFEKTWIRRVDMRNGEGRRVWSRQVRRDARDFLRRARLSPRGDPNVWHESYPPG